MWAKGRVVVWGAALPGSIDNVATGGEYDPVADAWSPLPPAPVGACPERAAVWTGAEIVYWGGVPRHCPAEPSDGAAYSPATNTWRVMAAAPQPHGFRYPEAVWTGREVVVWGGGYEDRMLAEGVTHLPHAAAYDPRKDSWRRLPDVPSPWSGDGAPALTVSHDGRVFVYRAGQMGLLDEKRGKWTPVGDPAPRPRGVPGCSSIGGDVVVGVVLGDEVRIWQGNCGRSEGVSFDIEFKEWRRLRDAPFGYPSDLVVAGRFLYAAADGDDGKVAVYRYDVAADRWADLPRDELDVAVSADVIWTGQELLVMNGFRVDGGPRTGAAYRPGADGPRSKGGPR